MHVQLSLALALACVVLAPGATTAQTLDRDTILVDFGSPNARSPAPWNNVTDPHRGTITDLTNARSLSTGYGLAVVDSFNSVNATGTAAPDPALGIDPAAASDSFFGNVAPFGGQLQPTAAVALTGLDTALQYTLTLFASRTANDNRQTRYLARGATVDSAFLDAATNTDAVARVRLRPDSTGRIVVACSPGPDNTNSSGFYYLGALVITYPEQPAVGPRELSLVDPNGGEVLQVGAAFEIQWRSRNVPAVVIDYSLDGGTSWRRVDSVAATPMRYAWVVPASPTAAARVRVRADTLQDVSDGAFVITADTTRCRLVVIGSSTAAGTGASSPDSAWVGRFRENLTGDNTRYEVVNLARGGYTTFQLLPDGSTLGTGVGIAPDTARNISAALALRPFAIIVNLPSNDAARLFPTATQLRNFALIDSVGRAGGARVYFATTQPRNFADAAQIALQREVRDSILARYGTRALDFWSPLAAPDGTIVDSLDSGDGVHVNDAGHRLLFEQVRAARLDTVSCALLSTVTPARTEGSGLRLWPNPVYGDRVYVELGDFAASEEVEVAWFDTRGRRLSVERLRVSANREALSVARPRATGGTQVVYCAVQRLSDGRQIGRAVLWLGGTE